MAGTHLSIRIDLASGDRIGPGKIALLEAIRSTGSISAAARSIGMSYRRAWLLVEEINQSLREPAVTAETGGVRGGGAVVTPVGERVVGLYRADRIRRRERRRAVSFAQSANSYATTKTQANRVFRHVSFSANSFWRIRTQSIILGQEETPIRDCGLANALMDGAKAFATAAAISNRRRST